MVETLQLLDFRCFIHRRKLTRAVRALKPGGRWECSEGISNTWWMIADESCDLVFVFCHVMNWCLVLSCMMPSSPVTYCIVVFRLLSLILSYWTVLCCVTMPDLPSCQSCLSARTTWENLGMVFGIHHSRGVRDAAWAATAWLFYTYSSVADTCFQNDVFIHYTSELHLFLCFFFALVIGCHWSLGYWLLHGRIWRIVRTPSDPCSQRPGSGMFTVSTVGHDDKKT